MTGHAGVAVVAELDRVLGIASAFGRCGGVDQDPPAGGVRG
ncbi:MAG TPA: hypothetical protein VFC16_19630 [Nakamurella sp.]|nr:hypothetical protein [Nakamurella sp.]